MLDFDIDNFRVVFNKYTRKAFNLLPKTKNPNILDIGCGRGNCTMELARLTDGKITGIDIDQEALNHFKKKIEKQGFSDRIEIIYRSLTDNQLQKASFDIAWAEGVIHIVGFERSLKEVFQLLKPKGYFVVHDEVKNTETKFKKLSELGFTLKNHFSLPKDAWLKTYCEPLAKRILEIRKETKDKVLLKELERHENDIKWIKNNPDGARSMFYILQKS